MENTFNNAKLIEIILKWKWHILIILAIAALVSIIISSPWVMKPKFKSVGVIYPSNIAPYSDESETEQMLQWITSKDVRDSVIKKFNLPKYYGIDSSYKYFASTMAYLYDKNVKVAKTQFESIEITVYDWNPVFARDMVNAILYYTDLKIRATHRKKYDEVVESMKKVLDMKKAEVDSVKNILKEISSTAGLYSIEGQSQEITRGILRTIQGGGSGINQSEVAKMKKGMEERGGELLYLNFRVEGLANEYSELMLKYDQAVFDSRKDFTFINVVTAPQVADKKSLPKRPLIMLYFIFGALVFSILTIAIIENRKAFLTKKL